MIEQIVRLGIRRPLLGIALVGTSAVFGFLAFRTIPTDVFPDLSTPTFNLILQNSAYAPEEIETAITIPLETSLNGMQGVRRIRSQSAPGVSQITVEFEPDVDYKSARQQIAERVAQAAQSASGGR